MCSELYIAYATKYIVCSVRLDRCFVAGFSDGINVTVLFHFLVSSVLFRWLIKRVEFLQPQVNVLLKG